jgi:hypothetical protein
MGKTFMTSAQHIYSQQLSFRRGASGADEGVYNQYMTEVDTACNKAENLSAQSISQLFDILFTGSYTYKRQISSPALRIEGLAHFKKTQDSECLYHEKGKYCLEQGKTLNSNQQRFFIWNEVSLIIQKKDRSILHQLIISDNAHIVDEIFPLSLHNTHLCKKDHYKLHLCISSPRDFSTHYIVQGPSKNYTIDTVYTKIV